MKHKKQPLGYGAATKAASARSGVVERHGQAMTEDAAKRVSTTVGKAKPGLKREPKHGLKHSKGRV